MIAQHQQGQPSQSHAQHSVCPPRCSRTETEQTWASLEGGTLRYGLAEGLPVVLRDLLLFFLGERAFLEVFRWLVGLGKRMSHGCCPDCFARGTGFEYLP